jgi:hypothetical protein
LSGDLIAAGKARGSGLKQDPASPFNRSLYNNGLFCERPLVGTLLVEPCVCVQGDQGHSQVI